VRWKGRRHGPRQYRRWANAWSPEQIARRLPVDFPDDDTMRISHEAIYQALFVQSRGALRRELTAWLRTRRVLRMPRARTRGRGKTFISPEIMISQRPAEAADRAVPGHWEGDLILHGFRRSTPQPSLHAATAAASSTHRSHWRRHPAADTCWQSDSRPGDRSRTGTLAWDRVRLPSEPGGRL
jgi:IS30 family transposase